MNAGQSRGVAQPLERVGQPGAGGDLRPIDIGFVARLLERRAGQQAHRFAERQAAGCRLLDRLEARQHALQSLAIDFHPAAPYELQAVGAGQELPDLRRTQGLAIEAQFHAEIEQGVLTQHRGRRAAHGGADRRARWPSARPGAWHAHDDAGGLQRRHIGEKSPGVGAGPT